MSGIESDFTSLEAMPLSTYEKAALGGNDPRCIPQHLDAPPPMCSEIVYPNYTEEEHQIWQTLYRRQAELLPNRACDEFLRGVEMLKLNPNRIPSLADLSNVLESQTDWCIARIPGLLHEQDFFKLLAERVFPSTDYIRGKDELGYTPAPDIFHDVFGHMPMLTNRDFADFYQLFGKAALNAKGADRTAFGLIETPKGRRIYGAGTLSSATEVLHSLSDEVIVHRFSPEKVINQDYDVWHLQPILFAIESFEELKQGFYDWTRSRGLL